MKKYKKPQTRNSNCAIVCELSGRDSKGGKDGDDDDVTTESNIGEGCCCSTGVSDLDDDGTGHGRQESNTVDGGDVGGPLLVVMSVVHLRSS